jgi:serine/threonine protein kinase
MITCYINLSEPLGAEEEELLRQLFAQEQSLLELKPGTPYRIGEHEVELSHSIIKRKSAKNPQEDRYQVLTDSLYQGAQSEIFRSPLVMRIGPNSTLEIKRKLRIDKMIYQDSRPCRELETSANNEKKCTNQLYGGAKLPVFIDRIAHVFMHQWLGQNLEKIVGQKQLSTFIRKLRVILNCITAVGLLHQKNWVHCDIKPSNFMCDPRTLQTKLIDFSSSKELENPPQKIMGIFVGTALYRPPDLLPIGTLQPSYDIYGLGAVFGTVLGAKNLIEKKRKQFKEDGGYLTRTFFEMPYDFSGVDIPEEHESEITHLLERMTYNDPNVRPSLGEIQNCFQTILNKETAKLMRRPVSPTCRAEVCQCNRRRSHSAPPAFPLSICGH